ncbi:hypothetical protein ACM0IS_02425 [Mycoplasma aquilae ATCC BAA-1896]|uniref:hypothetical protein n=1 Tax=Mycoplasma aquilae TaxID=1312741 RepID=UPI003A8A10BC
MKKLINIAQLQMQQFVDTLNNKEKEFREKINSRREIYVVENKRNLLQSTVHFY